LRADGTNSMKCVLFSTPNRKTLGLQVRWTWRPRMN